LRCVQDLINFTVDNLLTIGKSLNDFHEFLGLNSYEILFSGFDLFFSHVDRPLSDFDTSLNSISAGLWLVLAIAVIFVEGSFLLRTVGRDLLDRIGLLEFLGFGIFLEDTNLLSEMSLSELVLLDLS
jgi:hypothetical protein